MKKDERILFALTCLALILAIAMSPWSAVARASPAVELRSQQDHEVYSAGGSGPGIYLTGGWNLISLPVVPFDTSIDNVLAALAYPYDLLSVWHYDPCEDEWLVYGEGHTSLKTMEAGKAYWIRMRYPDEQHPDPAVSGTYPYALWVFGTRRPMPPSLPSSYNVCAGWNMVGFTSTEAMAPTDYLSSFSPSEYGTVYGWDPVLANWVSNPAKLVPGRGYWIPFSAAGTICP
jgi:hypothetical protein